MKGKDLKRIAAESGKRRKQDASLPDSAIQFLDAGVDNEYAATVDVGHKVDPRAQKIFVIAVVCAAVFALGLVLPEGIYMQAVNSTQLGGGYSVAMFFSDVADNVQSLLLELSGDGVPWKSFSSNAIKFAVIAVSGAGLALCGAVYQGTFRNALVSPSTLGVMSGGTLGLSIWIAAFVSEAGNVIVPFVGEVGTIEVSNSLTGLEAAWRDYSMVLFSFVGCLVVVAVVLLVMRFARGSSVSPILMIITGQLVAGVAGAVSASIRYYFVALNPYSGKAQLFTNLMIASFWRSYSWVDIVSLLLPLAVVFAVIMHFRQRMMLLAFDEGERRSMGVDTRRMQVVVVALCTLLTAIIVSFCGTVGFVGFLVPHLARRVVGPNFKYLLPATCVLGATFVLGAFVLLCTLLGSTFDTMVGMFISIGGAAVFLVTALRGKGASLGKFS